MIVRAATVGDYDAFARLAPELGVEDQIATRERFAAELVARTIVAEDRGAVVGYALLEQLTDTGYVRNVVADPAVRRRGIGRALMAAARERFVAAGARTWCLNVQPTNTPAIALYAQCGLATAQRTWMTRLPREAVLPPPPVDTRLVPAAPERDAELEAKFGLLAGQLASARARPSRTPLVMVRGDAVLGVAVYFAVAPGAFPFRLLEPALAGALLAHLWALAPSTAPYLQVSSEGDPALRDALFALGARLYKEIDHMRGEL